VICRAYGSLERVSFYETSNSCDQEQQYLFSPVLKRAEEREYNVRTPPPFILHALILRSTILHPKIPIIKMRRRLRFRAPVVEKTPKPRLRFLALFNIFATSLALPCSFS
jgi:hypothetical protein